ncbi:MAG TPA: GNAT family N-acetyltransferase [Ktedonobacterales bacterium]|jgi:predicted acetyltransferase
MPWEIRPITPEELPAFIRTDGAAYSFLQSDEEIESARGPFEFDRSLVAVEDERFIGSAAAMSFDLTLPGFTTTPVAGVTWVAVLPTHRRRGVLTSIMRRQLEDVRARGEALAVLTASESAIYRRFGYGAATSVMYTEIERAHSAFLSPVNISGRCRLVEHEVAVKEILPPLYDNVRRACVGELSRTAEKWWGQYRLANAPGSGFGPHLFVVYESDSGQVDGAVVYRARLEWSYGAPDGTLEVIELIARTPEAYAALWRYCLDVDLVARVHGRHRPVDEPLRWMLADSRRLRVTHLADNLWVRLLDISAALSARRYATAGRLIVEVEDAFLPDVAGRYTLEGGPDGANCALSDAPADLSLDVAALGATYLGDVSFTSLTQAGLVREETPGALARADAMFATFPAPYCSTRF